MGSGEILTLTDGMTGLRDKPLKIEFPEVLAFLGEIANLNTQLDAQVTNATNLHAAVTGPNVGNFPSAVDTQRNLGTDIDEFIEAVRNFRKYLSAFHDTVAVASGNIAEVGRS